MVIPKPEKNSLNRVHHLQLPAITLKKINHKTGTVV